MPFIQLQFRRDTSNNWSCTDPILASGELAIELDTNLFKIGDGRTPWRRLPYGGLQGPAGPVGGSAGGPYYIELSYNITPGSILASGSSATSFTTNLLTVGQNAYTFTLGPQYLSITNNAVTTNANAWKLSLGPMNIQYASYNTSLTSWISAPSWGYTTPSAGLVTTNTSPVVAPATLPSPPVTTIDTVYANLCGTSPFVGTNDTGETQTLVFIRIFVQPFFFS